MATAAAKAAAKAQKKEEKMIKPGMKAAFMKNEEKEHAALKAEGKQSAKRK